MEYNSTSKHASSNSLDSDSKSSSLNSKQGVDTMVKRHINRKSSLFDSKEIPFIISDCERQRVYIFVGRKAPRCEKRRDLHMPVQWSDSWNANHNQLSIALSIAAVKRKAKRSNYHC